MKTPGDYSKFCRELTKALREVGNGEVRVMQFGMNPDLLLLELDGMIKSITPNGEFQTLELTDKGRKFLNRGGYSDFKNPLREDLSKTCIINYSDDKFFIPHPEDYSFDDEFSALGGRCICFNAFGRGYDFPMDLKERVITLFKEQCVEYFEI